ncbi:YdeI/OmpD-associated family protein [Blastopirellula sp. J2-11]|uniref:DUF1801 domain-containing protein n=1 Tax=Blastopirellula sp. J2-11 TaxID=2943192 RepID=UPI0021C6C297|nr:YdeI/OmpD-associated family protein [Blastopirellula sp. J2-11]UUO05393.1 YdeI/OmpD-associated family protein [Blastopirellula sp. J2-11]
MNPKVNEYLKNAKLWPQELRALRKIILASELAEDFKWRSPCYTYQGSNVLIIGELKACCTLGFLKGSLLKDPHGVLTKPGENSRAARMMSFTHVGEVTKAKSILQAYIQEAIEIEKAGLKVDFEQNREMDIPVELQQKWRENPSFKTAFDALTPGRQRGYLLHFTAAKQSPTRESRIEKATPRILAGKGLEDCICGLSKKMPRCDGSHKGNR